MHGPGYRTLAGARGCGRGTLRAMAKAKKPTSSEPALPSSDPALPGTRAELMALHRETRTRRNKAAHGSPEHVEAIDLLGKIEVEIARIERAMDPPVG